METGATDAEIKQMIDLHIQDNEIEAREVVARIIDRNEYAIRSMLESEKRCAKRFEQRHRSRLATRAMVMGTIAGMALCAEILFGIWSAFGIEPGILPSAALSLACGMLGAFLGWYVAR